MEYNLQNWMHSQSITNGRMDDSYNRPIQPKSKPIYQTYPTPTPSPQPSYNSNATQRMINPMRSASSIFSDPAQYAPRVYAHTTPSPQLPYNPIPVNPASTLTQPAAQPPAQISDDDQPLTQHTPELRHLGLHLQYISPATGLPTPYYIPMKHRLLYPTATSLRTDALVWPHKGMEMSKEERLKQIKGPSEEERGEIELRQREEERREMRWGDEEVERRRENDRKEFCVEPPSGLSEGQVGKWSVLFEALFEDDELDPENLRARRGLRRLQRLGEIGEGTMG